MTTIFIVLGIILAIWIVGAIILWPWRSTSSFGSVNKSVAAGWPFLVFLLIMWFVCGGSKKTSRRGFRRRRPKDMR